MVLCNEAKMTENTDAIEEQLITYLKNILECQIIPVNFMNLRDLVKDAPENLKLYEYVEAKYPGIEFLSLLRKYPEYFNVNSDRTVVIAGPHYCTLPYCDNKQLEEIHDTVDGNGGKEHVSDRKEYISGSESDLDNDERHKLLIHSCSSSQNAESSSTAVGTNFKKEGNEASSSDSETSGNCSSSEIVPTSDSLRSTLSSSSSTDN